jgi:hypothetical protein
MDIQPAIEVKDKAAEAFFGSFTGCELTKSFD